MLPGSPAFPQNPRYRLLDALGAGGMGIVYRVWDRLTQEQVALKRVLTPNYDFALSHPESLDLRLALAGEFQILASLRHPHIVRVLDYGFDADGQPYFTMELLDSAETILNAGQDKPVNQKIDLLVQLLQAIAYLHRRGILHRDLKPPNVLVSAGRVTVLDFGLSVNIGQDTQTAGTLAYMAPEVLAGDTPGEAADLYAVGVIAYQMFAGQHPFATTDISALVESILHESPNVAVLNLNSGISAVISGLLAKSLEDRPADAVTAIEIMLGAAGLSLPPETRETRESFLQAAQFVGRSAEFALLVDELPRVINNQGSAWLIGGESGVGKSRLIAELGTRALVAGMLVLHGQAVSEGGGLFHVWTEILRALLLHIALPETDLSALKTILPDLPQLLERDVPDADRLDAQGARVRLISIITALLRSIPGPVLIVLEDLQWADAESLAALSAITSFVGSLPLLLIGSYRSDERPDLPETLPEMQSMLLNPLTPVAVAELSAAMLGPAGQAAPVIELIQRETEGNIFFLVEVVRSLAEEAGQLDRIGFVTLPQHVFTGGVRGVIQRRLSRMPAQNLPLLQLAATLGRELDLPALRAADPDANLNGWVAQGVNAAVFDVRGERTHFAHDKLREAVLEALPTAELPHIHRRAALALEAAYPERPEQTARLAFQWRMAGEPEREAYYSAKAGERALTLGSFQEAADYLERATMLLSGLDTGQYPLAQARRATVETLLGEALFQRGDYPAAQEVLTRSITYYRSVGAERGLAQAFVALGRVAERKALYAEAAHDYAEALLLFRGLGDTRGEARALNFLSTTKLYAGILHEAHAHIQASVDLFRRIDDREGLATALTSLGNTLAELNRREEARQATLDALELYRQIGNRHGISMALNNLAVDLELAGKNEEERPILEEALGLARSSGNPGSVAIQLGNMGNFARRTGQFAFAETCCEEALRIFTRINNPKGQLSILTFLALIQEQQGRLDEAYQYHQQVLAVATRIGLKRYIAIAQTNLGWMALTRENVGQAEHHFREAVVVSRSIDYIAVTLEALLGLADVARRGGRADSGAEAVGFVMAHPARFSELEGYIDTVLNTLRSQTPDDALNMALERGRTLSLDAVVAVLA